MVVRTYAQVVGVVLVLLGVIGLLLGEERLFGLLNVDLLEDMIHLASGGLLIYAGLLQRSARLTRGVVGALGAFYLLVGALGFVVPFLFGLLPHGYSIFDNLVHVVLGILSLLIYATSRLPEAERRAVDPRA
jgi:hypothetical protein